MSTQSELHNFTDYAGSIADFEQIAQEYGNLLLRTARLLVENEQLAEDVVQTSLELAWRNLASLRDRKAMKTWLVKIVMNQAMTVLRREARSYDFLRESARTYQNAVASAYAAEANATQEVLWDLRSAIHTLPIEQRAVIVLHYYLDMSIPEIASMLEISPNTIKKRLGAALRRLRETLGRDPFPSATITTTTPSYANREE